MSRARARKPAPARTREELRRVLEDAWAAAVGVAEELKERHPEAFAHCRLSVRMLTGCLIAIDRAVAELPR
ncbi:MAG TPA: hypothetical protein VFQ35_00030 [Polyangiaceae bacterium]|nr:hypothetical protein [Polyangiaceae bacterium]